MIAGGAGLRQAPEKRLASLALNVHAQQVGSALRHDPARHVVGDVDGHTGEIGYGVNCCLHDPVGMTLEVLQEPHVGKAQLFIALENPVHDLLDDYAVVGVGECGHVTTPL